MLTVSTLRFPDLARVTFSGHRHFDLPESMEEALS